MPTRPAVRNPGAGGRVNAICIKQSMSRCPSGLAAGVVLARAERSRHVWEQMGLRILVADTYYDAFLGPAWGIDAYRTLAASAVTVNAHGTIEVPGRPAKHLANAAPSPNIPTSTGPKHCSNSLQHHPMRAAGVADLSPTRSDAANGCKS